MYVLRKNRGNLCFIAHPRTASRAASKALLAAGASVVGGHHGLNEAQCRRTQAAGGTVACVGRNMFDVMVSWWHNASFEVGTTKPVHDRTVPFDEYLHDKAYTTTHRWFQPKVYHYGLSLSDLVIRYEDLEAGVRKMFTDAGLSPKAMPIIGASKRTDYRAYYTPGLREIVEDRWGDDLKLTGHEF